MSFVDAQPSVTFCPQCFSTIIQKDFFFLILGLSISYSNMALMCRDSATAGFSRQACETRRATGRRYSDLSCWQPESKVVMPGETRLVHVLTTAQYTQLVVVCGSFLWQHWELETPVKKVWMYSCTNSVVVRDKRYYCLINTVIIIFSGIKATYPILEYKRLDTDTVFPFLTSIEMLNNEHGVMLSYRASMKLS